MIEHPDRRALHNEVHARPPEPMQAPLAISHVVMLADSTAREASRGHLQALLPNATLYSSDVLGINPDAKEAILFALLANEAVAGTPLFAGGHATKIPITMGKFSFPT